jgi:hypothetical protein
MHGRIHLAAFIALTPLVGCFETPAAAPVEEAPATKLAQAFDPKQTGTIRGRVLWDGAVPVAQQTVVRANAYNPNLYKNPAAVTTTHVPKVNPKTAGVENAVVFLRNVDPQRSKPWSHAKVRVEFKDRQLVIDQGGLRSSVGFVQRGGAIEIVNRDSEYQLLHARGDAFFAMPLIEPNQMHERVLTKAGIVDLKSAAGYYWLHAHLFVSEHPYFARTDADGRFTLEQAPAGTYEIVCWLPSWRVLRSERDPETGMVARLVWEDPRELTQTVRVEAGGVSEITYRWELAIFGER